MTAPQEPSAHERSLRYRFFELAPIVKDGGDMASSTAMREVDQVLDEYNALHARSIGRVGMCADLDDMVVGESEA